MTHDLVLASSAEPLLRLAGRLHPVVVHFPIALLITGAAIELFRAARRKPPASDSALACVALGALGAAAAAGAGWLNADYESHPVSLASTLTLHRWLGVATACTAALVLLLALAARSKPGARAPYTLALLACAILVGTTGHFGGTMVHGEGYLWEAFGRAQDRAAGRGAGEQETPLPARTPPAGTALTVDFNRDVRPTFESRCIECHGPKKRKGGLRLDDPGNIFKGEQAEWVVAPGEPDASEIVRRLELPAYDHDHMPPKGDRVPREQIDLIRRWIQEGAYWTPPESPTNDAAKVPGAGTRGERGAPKLSLEQAAQAPDRDSSSVRALRAKGARVEPVSQGSTDLDANLGLGAAAVTDDDLAHLEPLAPRLTSLDLSRTSISDAGLVRLFRAGSFARLERLNLTETAITDSAAESLVALPSLSVLNLVGTAVSDTGAAVLARSNSLQRVYAWRSRITGDGAAVLRASRPGRVVELDSAPLAPGQ